MILLKSVLNKVNLLKILIKLIIITTNCNPFVKVAATNSKIFYRDGLDVFGSAMRETVISSYRGNAIALGRVIVELPDIVCRIRNFTRVFKIRAFLYVTSRKSGVLLRGEKLVLPLEGTRSCF